MFTNKSSLMGLALWGSLVLSMLASMHHVAASFGYLEKSGEEWIGWGAAIAIDASIVVFTYGLRTRRKANRSKISALRLMFGIVFLTAISVAANLNAALMNKPNDFLMAIAFSATLPLIVILLSDIASSDDERAAKRAERDEKKHDAEHETHNASDATHDASTLAESAKPKTYICALCAEGFENGAKLAAHTRWQHANHNGHNEHDAIEESAITGG